MDSQTQNKIAQLEQQIVELNRKFTLLTNFSTIPLEIENALIGRGFLKYDSDIYYEAGAGGNAFHDIFVKYGTQKFNLNIPNPLIAFTVNTSTNVCTAYNHGFADGNNINFYTTNTLPGGLDSLILTYFILDTTDDTFRLTTDGVNPIDITSAGVGIQYAQAY